MGVSELILSSKSKDTQSKLVLRVTPNYVEMSGFTPETRPNPLEMQPCTGDLN